MAKATKARVIRDLELGIKNCRQLFGYASDGHTFPVRVDYAEEILELVKSRPDEKALIRSLRDALVQMDAFFGGMAGACEPEAEAAIAQCRKVIAIDAALARVKKV